MASKQDFTSDEWTKLIESAMLAGVAITAADPHGLWGLLQEGFANAKGMVAGKQSATPLIREIVSTLETSEGRTLARDAIKARLTGASTAEVGTRCMAEIGEVAQILDAKAGADALPFKQWLYANAQRVAEASTEGGFLGFGGVKVSEKERATLAQLAAAMKLPVT